MKHRTTAYWMITSLVAAGMIAGGVADLSDAPAVVETMQRLGYPHYLGPLLGAWKLAGALVLLAPKLPRLKEWAYAGAFFDLSGASFSHAAVADPSSTVFLPLCILTLVVASWALRPESRRLGTLWPGRSDSGPHDTPHEPRATDLRSEPNDVITFWREAGPDLWFAKDPAFDGRFRERFAVEHALAARGELAHWARSAAGTLALLLLLDQYPRNAFRGTPRMYATDTHARAIASNALRSGQDREIDPALRVFMYLPLSHSEQLADQERAVNLARELGEPHLTHALGHRDIVKRFGRFPHRNPILGRPMQPEEQQFLNEGGFAG